MQRQNTRSNINAILMRREQLVAEVAHLRERGQNSKFIENAQQLLTRWWAAAGWNAREELLKTAGWLVRVEKRRGERVPSPV